MGFLAAMRDAWDQGALAWQRMADAAAQQASVDAPAGGPLAAMFAPWAELARAYAAVLPGGATRRRGAEAAREALGQVGDLSPALAEAAMVAAISAFRYARALAEICARHQGSVIEAMLDRASGEAAGASADSRVLIDDLRACLREIGDAASLEARRLQIELEQVGESIARAATADEPPPAPHQRPCRVKE
jgi:signal transduction histidine kinase